MILALHTASQPYSIGLLDDTRYTEHTFHATHTRSEALIDAITERCDFLEKPLQSLTAITITNGPGNYTSIRLGITTAKTLAQTLNIPIYPISTLEAYVAQHAVGTNTYLVTIPANSQEHLAALFVSHNSIYKRLTPDFTCNAADIPNLITQFKEPVIHLGKNPLNAHTLIQIAQKKYLAGEPAPYTQCTPHYALPPNIGKLKYT